MRNSDIDRMRVFAVDDEAQDIASSDTGLLRATVLFGLVTVGLALVVVPLAQQGADRLARNASPGIDMMMTGSIEKPRQYTVRRSVLPTEGGRHCVVVDGRNRSLPC